MAATDGEAEGKRRYSRCYVFDDLVELEEDDGDAVARRDDFVGTWRGRLQIFPELLLGLGVAPAAFVEDEIGTASIARIDNGRDRGGGDQDGGEEGDAAAAAAAAFEVTWSSSRADVAAETMRIEWEEDAGAGTAAGAGPAGGGRGRGAVARWRCPGRIALFSKFRVRPVRLKATGERVLYGRNGCSPVTFFVLRSVPPPHQ